MFKNKFKEARLVAPRLFLVITLMFLVLSCGDDDDVNIVIPVANFSTDITYLEVAFTDESTEAETYRWDFGVEDDDTDISTEASPSYTYTESGTYTVTLIVANSTGGSDVLQEEIVVTAAVIPTASYSFTSALGLDVSFDAAGSVNADTYLWDFGIDTLDTDSSTSIEPTYTFPGEGEFDVSLTVTSTDGFTDTLTQTVTVSRVAVVAIASFTFTTADLEVTFTDASSNASSYAWDFGVDGVDTDVSTEMSPSFTYPTFGTYEVSLTVTSSTGDTDTETMDVTVSLPAPTADFTFAATDLMVTFTDASTNADTYSWDFGDGMGTSTDASPTYTYATGGDFDVTLTVTTEDGQTATSTQSVSVIDPASNDPVADFTFVADELEVTFTDASTNAVSWSWDFGDNSGTSTDASPVYTYAAADTYTVSLTITNSDGDTDTEMMDVEVTDGAATFAAVVLNGTFDEHTFDTGDNADAWDMTPSSTIKDDNGDDIPSPYDPLWDNSDLNTYIDNTYCGNEQPATTSDGTFNTQGIQTRGAKFSENCRRLYQVVDVEVGIEYTFSIDTRSEVDGINTEVFILNTEISDEVAIDMSTSDASIDAYFNITNDFNSSKGDAATNTFTTSTFTFTPSTESIVIYVRSLDAIDGDNEVFIDNVEIITPGF